MAVWYGVWYGMGFSYHTTYHTIIPYHILQYASLELWEEPPKSVFVLVAVYLSATTDRQGSGVYIIFSSTDLPKILITCKCSTFNMLEIFS